jgi:hypothetical protein
MFRGLLLFSAVVGSLLSASEPLELGLPDLSSTWFESGAVVRVPMDKCGALQVRLGAPASQDFAADALELTMDGRYPRSTKSTSVEGHLLTIRTKEPLGLLVLPEHHVQVSASGRHPLHGEWTILRWDKAYIQSTVVAKEGVPIGIRLDQPPGGVVLGKSEATMIRFIGEVMGSDGSRLTIQNRPIKRLAGKSGFQFDEQIAVAADIKEIVVRASDDGEATSTTLILPVIRP